MREEIFYGVNQRLLGFLLLFCLLAASEIGFRLGLRVPGRTEMDVTELSVMQGSVLGLLALLLGFTFSLSMNRYERRKNLLIEEANAIGTASLRAKTMPHAAETQRLYRRYVDANMGFYREWRSTDTASPSSVEIKRLQDELWAQGVAAAAAAKDDRNAVTAIYLAAMNQVFDVRSLRLFAREDHVPEPVLIVLACVAVMSMLLSGYACGITGRRHAFPLALTCVIISLVIVLIMDLDRPGRGRIRIESQLLQEMKADLDRQTFTSDDKTVTPPH